MAYNSSNGPRRGLWAVVLIGTVASFVFATMSMFLEVFTPVTPVTLTSDRAGLVMESGGKVRMRGVEVGRVRTVQTRGSDVALQLDIDPDQVQNIPANVSARIRATTVFGSKFVDLVYPDDPSPQRIAQGAVIKSENVSTEVNTVFQNLVGLLEQVDPAKLNSVLGAFAEGLRGRGAAMGEAITATNEVLQEINPRAETMRRDWQSLKGVSDTYAAAAQDIVSILDTAATTSQTISDQATQLDVLLLASIGMSNSALDLMAPNQQNYIDAINTLEPTTALLLKYNPSITCTLVGAEKVMTDYDYGAVTGGNGYSTVLEMGFTFGSDPYQYPMNLPVNGAKGGPDGKPGCGSLPDATKNWPVRQLVTNTGWGRGMDWRPNPGIGFPGWANFFPVTRGVPEPPSLRYEGGPAPGPLPAYPGAPPYGAMLYAPDGTPLWPGLPAATPSHTPPPDPANPPPGAEPYTTPFPAQLAPTPAPTP